MPFFSNLLGRVVADLSGAQIGRLTDLVASAATTHPEIVALVVKSGRKRIKIPFSDVVVLIAPAIPLRKQADEIQEYQPGEHDLFLARDILDKQLIDTNGARVVRVNDLELARINGHFYVANVDISGSGLLRRLGIELLGTLAARMFRVSLQPSAISWDDVELLAGDRRIKLKVPGDKISELHPADLAAIISDLSRAEGSKLLESLDAKTVADTLEEVETDFQASLVEGMPDEKIVTVLEEMAPDVAADLLAELPEERSEELLSLMEDEEAKDVRKLLAYPEDSAGGIMTTEFISVSPDLKAQEAIEVLRQHAQETETMFYVYVADSQGKLQGVFSLSDLLFAQPDTKVGELMNERTVSVTTDASQDEVAQIVSKYNLRAVPVVDSERRLQGIVTADDALDKIIPTAWKKRLPRLYG